METPELCFRWLDIKKACQYEMAAVPTEWLPSAFLVSRW